MAILVAGRVAGRQAGRPAGRQAGITTEGLTQQFCTVERK